MSKILMKRKIPKKDYPNQMSLYEIFVEDIGSFIDYKDDIENIDKKYISTFEDLTTISRTFINSFADNIEEWKKSFANQIPEFLTDENINKIKDETIKESLGARKDITRQQIEDAINPSIEQYLNEKDIEKRMQLLFVDMKKIDNTDYTSIADIGNAYESLKEIDVRAIKNSVIRNIIVKLQDFSDGKIDGEVSKKVTKDEDTAKKMEEDGTVRLIQVYQFMAKNKLFDDLFRIIKKAQPFLDQWINTEIESNLGKNTDQGRKEQEINGRKAIISYIVELAIFEFIGKMKVQEDEYSNRDRTDREEYGKEVKAENDTTARDSQRSDVNIEEEGTNFNFKNIGKPSLEDSLLDIYMKNVYTEEEYLELFKPIKFTKNLFRGKFTTTSFEDLIKDVSVLTRFIKFISTITQTKTNKIIAEVNSLTGEDLKVSDIIGVMKEGISDDRLLYATTQTLNLLKNKTKMNLIIKKVLPQYIKKLKSIKVGETLGNVANFLDGGKTNTETEGETK